MSCNSENSSLSEDSKKLSSLDESVDEADDDEDDDELELELEDDDNNKTLILSSIFNNYFLTF